MSSLLQSRSSNSGSFSARGRVHVSRRLDELKSRPLGVITVWLMERPLRGFAGLIASVVTNPHGLIGKHDYLVIKFRDGGYIKAEKVGDSREGAGDAGIHIEPDYDPSQSDTSDNSHARFTSTINMCGLGCRLGDVLAILKNQKPDYDILADNCWKYAFSSTYSLLRWAYNMATDRNVRAKLRQDIDKLKIVERVMPRDFIHALRHPHDSRGRATIVKFQQRLANSQLQLPEDSLRRHLMSGVYNILSDL